MDGDVTAYRSAALLHRHSLLKAGIYQLQMAKERLALHSLRGFKRTELALRRAAKSSLALL